MTSTVQGIGDLATTLVGVSGEYFVAAELSRRGYIASITLRNTRGIDVLAANSDASKSVGIQVKTNTTKKKDWLLNEKADTARSDSHFYVFVNLNDPGLLPQFHVVPSKVVAAYVSSSHKKWESTLGRGGRPHSLHNPMRHFRDPQNEYLDKWELLGLD
jgi:hypothetical protein